MKRAQNLNYLTYAGDVIWSQIVLSRNVELQ